MRRFVVVTGLPASGKTTLAAGVAQALGWPHFDKDQLLEQLFDDEGVGDARWRTALSKRADGLLKASACSVANAVVSSWWRHPASADDSGTSTHWLAQQQTSVIELHCLCSPTVATNRFLARKRHRGHLDGRWSFHELLERYTAQSELGPLFPGKVIKVDTRDTMAQRSIQALGHQIMQSLPSV